MSQTSSASDRTRQAILVAAIDLFAVQPEASMTALASAAGVSRSTLHRYFVDRGELRAALDDLTVQRWLAAVRSARLDEGTGLEAFRRLIAELLDGLDVLTWWLLPSTQEPQQTETPEDRAMNAMVARGNADGSIDPRVDPGWLQILVWAVLYSVRFASVESDLTVFDARQQAMRTLLRYAAADPTAVT